VLGAVVDVLTVDEDRHSIKGTVAVHGSSLPRVRVSCRSPERAVATPLRRSGGDSPIAVAY
jgi:hypothetical protein